MAHIKIEHVNLTVSNPEKSADALERIFGWHERWRGPARDGGFSIHIGGNNCYLALYTGPNAQHAISRYGKGQPLNHIGIEVDHLGAIESKVIAEGFNPFSHDNYEPGRRFYFLDHDGIEFEVVSYAP